jgi:hypothetical protein
MSADVGAPNSDDEVEEYDPTIPKEVEDDVSEASEGGHDVLDELLKDSEDEAGKKGESEDDGEDLFDKDFEK